MAILKVVNNHSKSRSSLKKILDYVLKPEKTDEAISYVYGDYSADEITPKSVFDEFMRIKQMFGKEHGRMYQHGVISWHRDEAVKPEIALEFGKDFVSKQYPNNQTLVSVHTDREHVHLHFIVNTVSFMDGKMLHWKRSDLKAAKNLSDQLCIKYGFTVTQKGKHFDKTGLTAGEVTAWDKNVYAMVKDRNKESYLTDCMSALEQCLNVAGTQDVFRDMMKDRGWDVIWETSKKHITFINSDGKRVRDSKLNSLFNIDVSKENMERILPSKQLTITSRKHRHR